MSPISKPKLQRIAFVCDQLHHTARRISLGLSRVVTPAVGMIVREFVISEDRLAQRPGTFSPELLAWSPDGLVCFGGSLLLQMIDAGNERKVPCIWTSRLTDPTPRVEVLMDRQDFFRLAYEHLAARGAPVWRYLEAPEHEEQESIRPYREFTAQAGVPCHFYRQPDREEFTTAAARQKWQAKMDEWLLALAKPVSIFSTQFDHGRELTLACTRLGFKVPGDVAILGSDDYHVAASTQPTVSTIYMPAEAIGQAAGRVLCDWLRGQTPSPYCRVPGAKLIKRESTGQPSPCEWNLDAALAYIEAHACEGLQVQELLAQTQGIRRETFQRKFQEATGCSPRDMIEARRMQEAKRLLLETELSLAWISGMCGYADYLHFYKIFRKTAGVSPAKFREATR